MNDQEWGDFSRDRFMKAVGESLPSTRLVARMMREMGLEAQVNATDSSDGSDTGDIIVPFRVEVKHLSRNFTDTYWPFNNDHAIVDHVVHLPDCKPAADLLAYAFVSRDMDWIGWISRWTRGSWYVDPKHDGGHNRKRNFVVCPLTRVRFRRAE